MAHEVHIAGLAKTYGSQRVLGPLDLHLEAGTITVVIGRSGCGKSTLLRCLGGLEKPDAGSIRIGAGQLRREDIGYVFQEPRLMPWLTVSRNVAFGLRGHPARDDRVAEALAIVGLQQAASLLPKQLSGGMAQRAALARALAPKPELILLDEPFSALDPFSRESLQQHLLHLYRHYRTTMVLITHDMDEALTLGDRILVMQGPPGKIVADLSRHDTKARLREALEPGGRGPPGPQAGAERPQTPLRARAL
jgi:ABC-type nitrate/sulfonate/bicarbonate transport system ATPase subunit